MIHALPAFISRGGLDLIHRFKTECHRRAEMERRELSQREIEYGDLKSERP